MHGEAMQWAGDAMALGCALSWAIAVMTFRRAKEVDPVALNLFKNTLATLLLLPTMALSGVHFDAAREAGDWALLAISGVLGLAIADTLFLAGLRRIDASVAALADCAYAPTVLLLSITVLGEPMRLGLLVGAPLVVLGLVIVAWKRREAPASGAAAGGAKREVDRRGVLLAVAGVMTTAVGVVVARPALERSELLEATTIRLAAGSIALFAFEAVNGRARKALSLFRPQPVWRFALPATLFGTYIAMILWLGGMKYGTASRAALLNQSGAIWVLLFSRFAGEVVPWQRWIGAAIALGGVLVVLLG
jgi:drug/metabolite transporter (DMT)-like permease